MRCNTMIKRTYNENTKKEWFEIVVNNDVIAKVKSKGLAYIVAKELEKIYDNITIK